MNRTTNILLCVILISTMLLSSCQVLWRAVRYGDADVDDYNVFPVYKLPASPDNFSFFKGNMQLADTFMVKNKSGEKASLKEALNATSTRAFIVIRNDSVLMEEYFDGYLASNISTVFSVSKSVTGLLVGIALEKGIIESENDVVTKYIPELRNADSMFGKLTIRHLLDMRSGIQFDEEYNSLFSSMAGLYYGNSQLGKIKRMKFSHEPGLFYEYQSVSTALLGIVLEKASGKSMAEFFEENLWKPIGMQYDGSWSLDDNRHRSTKAYCGLNISASDLARIGRLMLKGGRWNNTQVVPEKWINQCLEPQVENNGYRNQWYSFSGYGTDSLGNRYFSDSLSAANVLAERYKAFTHHKLWQNSENKQWGISVYTGQFYALGIMHQLLLIDPKKNIIIVRLGDDNDFDYLVTMYNLCKSL